MCKRIIQFSIESVVPAGARCNPTGSRSGVGSDPLHLCCRKLPRATGVGRVSSTAFHYGNFIPGFCSGLTVGDWHNLLCALDDSQADHYPPLVEVLVERGSCGLVEMARAQHGCHPLPEGYVGRRHICGRYCSELGLSALDASTC